MFVLYLFIVRRPKIKLLLCARCNQVFNLSRDYQECKGAHGGGQYVDSLNAKVWGDPTLIFVLGFSNPSLTSALGDQLQLGDKDPEYKAGYGFTPMGREFDAFVIPNAAHSIIRTTERFTPV